MNSTRFRVYSCVGTAMGTVGAVAFGVLLLIGIPMLTLLPLTLIWHHKEPDHGIWGLMKTCAVLAAVGAVGLLVRSHGYIEYGPQVRKRFLAMPWQRPWTDKPQTRLGRLWEVTSYWILLVLILVLTFGDL